MMDTGKIRLWNRFYILICIVYFFGSMSSYIFSATFSLFIDSLGGSESLIGVMGTAFTLTAAISRLIGGRLSDKIGRRVIAVVGYLIFALGSMLLSLTTDFTLILIIRCVQGMGFAISATAVTAAVIDVVPKERMGEGIGYFGLGASLAQAVGPGLALTIFYGSGGFSAVCIVSVVSLVGSAISMNFCKYEKDPRFAGQSVAETPKEKAAEPQHESVIWRFIEKTAIPAGIIGFFMSFGSGVMSSFIALYADKSGIGNAGLYFTVSAVCVVVARLLTGRLSDKRGVVFTMVPGFVCGILALVSLILAPSVNFLLFVSGAFIGFGNGMLQPAINAAALERAPENRRGAASTTFFIPVDVGFSLSAAIGGVTIQYFGYTPTYLGAIVVFLCGIVLSIVFFGKRTRKKNSN